MFLSNTLKSNTLKSSHQPLYNYILLEFNNIFKCSKYSSSSRNNDNNDYRSKNIDRTRAPLPRSIASNLKDKSEWLKRQLSDPYVKQAQLKSYVSRAAFKLEELDDKLKVLKAGSVVVDLGATPGGWTQVAQKRVGNSGIVFSVDINEDGFELARANFIGGDFRSPETKLAIKNALLKERSKRSKRSKSSSSSSKSGTTTTTIATATNDVDNNNIDVNGFVDVVLSDMAPPYCGISNVDHERLIDLAGQALDFAVETLKSGGYFIAKVSRGGSENELLKRIQQHFTTYKSMKPDASRQESSEIYYIGVKFKSSNSSNSNNNNNGNNSNGNGNESIYD
ncbi:rRNA methyltransferase [Heterostelium album PN500]|uniref:rRNA methyltransferase 2, mitochondrial n=1 Tax=Heterostelium pallidum (strain ATCC 26659 / Pp 5 / PN500) TaxID=670386 RepID=D3B9Q4_HETP5|nr:rRNA methyltransferase [Heterostelium album PN500]EFA81966.1 rRNA methyltransferase [Heterostelium album PN500]|eukprot:XP_020434083.1 rRNA methyltransferase [Heterostelium album PN500]